MYELFLKSVLFGFGGVCVGGLRLAADYISDPVQPIVLCTSYQALQRDAVLLELLHELDGEMRELDLVAGIRVIHAADQLVTLRYRITAEPRLTDRVTGILSFVQAKRALQRFITRAEEVYVPRRVILVQRHVQAVLQQLDAHLQAIILATRDVYIQIPHTSGI